MVVRAKYPADRTPELAVRQIFGRQRLPENLRLLMADSGMLAIERIAMLGDTTASAKTTVRAIVGDGSKFGATDAERELSLTLVAAIWKAVSTLQDHFSLRRAKMEEDPRKIPEMPGEDHAEFRELFVRSRPDVLLTYHREPRRKLVERIHRDYMVHGAVAFYEVTELRARSDQIVQSGSFNQTPSLL